MRVLLDSHEEIRCGEETRVIPDILYIQQQWELLDSAGVTHDVLKVAIGRFIAEIIKNHGSYARRFCNKDPLTMTFVSYLHEMFPRAKYILMLRDGRATVYSILKRRVPVEGFGLKEPEASNDILGDKYCLPVYYEKLVLYPKEEMVKIFNFLKVPWSERVLHHHLLVGSEISLSPLEFSTSQVKKPINRNALNAWVGFYSNSTLEKMKSLAPMLTKLGYNATDSNPDYAYL
uniref:Protein-tyrosine sulfotransferase n=1 Tax=Syphacia muris TaxID=451379 RepID=A0A0N5AYK9_9BILA